MHVLSDLEIVFAGLWVAILFSTFAALFYQSVIVENDRGKIREGRRYRHHSRR